MNEEAGKDENSDGKTKQAEDGNEWRDRFGNDGENSHGALDGKLHWAEMLQIESDAQVLGPRRKNGGDRFPAQQHSAGNNGILEEEAESEKDGAVSETGERGDQEIGAELAEAGAFEHVGATRCTEAKIRDAEASENRCFEKR